MADHLVYSLSNKEIQDNNGLSLLLNAPSGSRFKLERLVLNKNKIKDEDLVLLRLKEARHLKYIQFTNQEITDKAIGWLVEVMYHVSYMDIRFNKNLSVQGLKFIAKAASVNNVTLKIGTANKPLILEKDMSHCNLSDIDLIAIAPLIQTNYNLEEISFSGNQIGDKGVGFLAEALSINCSIRRLRLDNNLIGTKGFRSIYKALSQNVTLEQLDLRENSKIKLGLSFRRKISKNSKTQWPLFQFDILLDCATWQNKKAGSYVSRLIEQHGEKAENISPRIKKPSSDLYSVKNSMRKKHAHERKSHEKAYGNSTLKNRYLIPPSSRPQSYSSPLTRRKCKTLGEEKQDNRVKKNTTAKMVGNLKVEESSLDSIERGIEKQKFKPVSQCNNTEKIRKETNFEAVPETEEILENNEPSKCSTRRSSTLDAIITLQNFARCNIAVKRIQNKYKIKKISKTSVSDHAAAAVQKIARGIMIRKQAKFRAAGALIIQKNFRAYFAHTRLVNAVREAMKQPVIKQRIIDSVSAIKVTECGMSEVCGKYIAGNIHDDGTRRYVFENNETQCTYSIERLTKEGAKKMWILSAFNPTLGKSQVLFANEANGSMINPPLKSWKVAHEDISLPVPNIEVIKDNIRAPNPTDVNMLKIVDSGNKLVSGLYVEKGISDNVPAFKKMADENGEIASENSDCEMYVRRIKYHSGKIWIIGNGDGITARNVFYVNKIDGDSITPPTFKSGNWRLGQDGKLPVPLLVKQESINRNSKEETKQRTERTISVFEKEAIHKAKQENLIKKKLEQIKSEQEEEKMNEAARKIQRSFRTSIILKICKSRRTLRELQQIKSLEVTRCGELSARGTYHLAGASENHSNSMRYIKTYSENISFVIERTNKEIWSLYQLKDGVFTLLYANSFNGYSLLPPKRRWQTMSGADAPSPVINWVENDLEKNIQYKISIRMFDAGKHEVCGTYLEKGTSDDVPMYRLSRDSQVQLRRIQLEGNKKMWLILKGREPYYCNTEHGTSITPPVDHWVTAQSGQLPPPVVVIQTPLSRKSVYKNHSISLGQS